MNQILDKGVPMISIIFLILSVVIYKLTQYLDKKQDINEWTPLTATGWGLTLICLTIAVVSFLLKIFSK
jgi:hypothetical protein